MNEKLKPCPYCRSKARILTRGRYVCIACSCCITKTRWKQHLSLAVDAWNRRMHDDE